MKKTMLIISISFIFILSYVTRAYAPAAQDYTYNNISKVYIEYENGQNQVLTINPPVSYTFSVDKNQLTNNTGSLQLLIRGQLNQDSKISKIALWMESITTTGDDNWPIGGYYGLDRTKGASFGEWITGYSEISSWYSGIQFSGTSGALNFNQTLTYNGPADYSTSANGSFDAQNKKVTIQLKNWGVVTGSSIQIENL